MMPLYAPPRIRSALPTPYLTPASFLSRPDLGHPTTRARTRLGSGRRRKLRRLGDAEGSEEEGGEGGEEE